MRSPASDRPAVPATNIRANMLFASLFLASFATTALRAQTADVAADGVALTGDPAAIVHAGPRPAWVEATSWEVPATGGAPGAAAEAILIDGQDNLTTGASEYYYHTVVRLLTPEGVSQNAQQTNQVTPEFEKVTWHTLKVYRDGKVQDRLPSAKFKKLQRELALETQMLTGETTMATVLEDIRVGDVLETEYTLHYHNPLFEGRLGARHDFGAAYPVDRERVIVHLPANGPAVRTWFIVPDGTKGLPDSLYRLSELQTALTNEATEAGPVIRWEGRNLPRIEFDGNMAARAYPYWPRLRISSFTTWGDVVDWAEPLFSADKLPDPLPGMIEEWRKNLDPDRRLAAAVRWVQNDVRYFALEFGQHALRPRPLGDVCSSRYGDCKDKSLLLVTLLRALGFEAWPALVNTYWRDRLHDVRPDPYAFNHAIVAYKFHDQLHWVDPTLKKQSGRPGEWALPPYRTALIIRRAEDDLTDIPPVKSLDPDTFTLDRITVDPGSGEATIDTQVTLRGLQADYYRPTLESVSGEERGKLWFNFIARFYRRLDEIDPPAATDDPATDTIVFRARYRLPKFLRTENGESVIATYGYAIRALLDPPESRRRHWPYPLPADRFIRHRIEVQLPFDLPPDQQPQVIRTEGLDYRIERGLAGNRLVIQHDLRTSSDTVPAERMGQFCDDVEEILNNLATAAHKPLPKKAEAAVSEQPKPQEPTAPSQTPAG